MPDPLTGPNAALMTSDLPLGKSGQPLQPPAAAKPFELTDDRARQVLDALGPLGEAGTALGEMIRTGQVRAEDLPIVAAGALTSVSARSLPGAAAVGRAGRAVATELLPGGTALMKGLEDVYPKVGPPILKNAATNKVITGKTEAEANKLVEAGEAYWGKQLTPEAEKVRKVRLAAQKDIDRGNYKPYFNVEQRADVDPTRYAPYKSTTDILPARPETIKRYMEHAANPAGVERLQQAYERGLKLPNAGNWYFLSQLEKEFIKEYGVEQGPLMFKQRVADALAATTGGADPNANLMMAHYGNYLQARGLLPPEESNQYPFPVGGRYAAGNIEQYQKMLMEGGTGVTAANPKRYNFSMSFLGNPEAGTIDEQMSKLYDPKMSMPPTGTYGAYQQVLNDLARHNGVDPRYFQEVAWSGQKITKDAGYKPKPMIQEYNEAIERTSRITGLSPAEVVRRGVVRAEIPLYGAAGIIGAGAAIGQQDEPANPAGAVVLLPGHGAAL